MTTDASSAPPMVPPRLREIDFPTWLPPMLVKELRQGLRTRAFVMAFVAIQGLMTLILLAVLFGHRLTPGSQREAFAAITAMFFGFLSVLLLLLVPARALGSLRSEVDSRSLELLVLTRLSATRIVLGKWGSLMAQGLLLFFAMLPYGVLRYFGGGVDLVEDAKIGLLILGGSALLTAAGLWTSSLPRGFQIIVPIAVVVGFQSFFVAPMRGASAFSWNVPAVGVLAFLLNGAFLLMFFLLSAIRRIAPLAENHALLGRTLPILPLALAPVTALVGRSMAGRQQLGFALAFMMLVAALELANLRRPLSVHWREWSEGGPLRHWLTRLGMPGWPNALLSALVATLLGACLVKLPIFGLSSSQSAEMLWRILLGLEAVIFPAIVMELLRRRGGVPVYFFAFIGMTVLGVLGASLGKGSDFEGLVRCLPVASFWLSLDHMPSTAAAEAANFAALLGTLGLAGYLAFPHWRASRAASSAKP